MLDITDVLAPVPDELLFSESIAMDDQDFLRAAIRLASANLETQAGGPFGAVVVRDHQIIGEGWNQVTSTHDPTAHAEIVAIRAACRQLRCYHLTGCTIYSSCEPCPMCWSAIYWARLSQIHYAATQDDAAAIGFADRACYDELRLPTALRSLPSSNHLREEAVAVMNAWSVTPNRIPY